MLNETKKWLFRCSPIIIPKESNTYMYRQESSSIYITAIKSNLQTHSHIHTHTHTRKTNWCVPSKMEKSVPLGLRIGHFFLLRTISLLLYTCPSLIIEVMLSLHSQCRYTVRRSMWVCMTNDCNNEILSISIFPHNGEIGVTFCKKEKERAVAMLCIVRLSVLWLAPTDGLGYRLRYVYL